MAFTACNGGADAFEHYEKQAKPRMSEGGKKKGVETLPPLEIDHKGKARDQAGKDSGVSGKSV